MPSDRTTESIDAEIIELHKKLARSASNMDNVQFMIAWSKAMAGLFLLLGLQMFVPWWLS